MLFQILQYLTEIAYTNIWRGKNCKTPSGFRTKDLNIRLSLYMYVSHLDTDFFRVEKAPFN